MPIKELQLALQGCPQCADIAETIIQNKAQVMSAAGGVAGTLALLIQTANDLDDLIRKLRGEDGSPDKVTVEIERKWEEGSAQEALQCDDLREVLDLPEDANEEEIHEELEKDVAELMSHDLQDFSCSCVKCSSQSTLADFEV